MTYMYIAILTSDSTLDARQSHGCVAHVAESLLVIPCGTLTSPEPIFFLQENPCVCIHTL